MAYEIVHCPLHANSSFRTARYARRGRTTWVKRRDLSTATPAWLCTRRGVKGQSLRAISPTIVHYMAPPPLLPRGRVGPQRCRLNNDTTSAPWTTRRRQWPPNPQPCHATASSAAPPSDYLAARSYPLPTRITTSVYDIFSLYSTRTILTPC
jgi:hypothetical protein